MNKERILCAAIHYDDDGKIYFEQPVNIKIGFVICGYRHKNCEWVDNRKITQDFYHIQGFLTSFNRFVDRKEAFKIALDTGLLQVETWNGARTIKSHRMNGELSSEDLY